MADGFLSDVLGLTAIRDGVDPTKVANVDVLGQLGVRTRAFSSSVSFARTADTAAYLGGDLIGINNAGSPGAAALTFADIANSEGDPVMITSSRLRIDITGIISGMTYFELALYSVTPPSALVDNNPFDLVSGDRASFLGIINLGSPADRGSTLYIEQNGINKQIHPASSSVFGYLITGGAWTPTSGINFAVDLFSAGF
jgi:hypothetical protein